MRMIVNSARKYSPVGSPALGAFRKRQPIGLTRICTVNRGMAAGNGAQEPVWICLCRIELRLCARSRVSTRLHTRRRLFRIDARSDGGPLLGELPVRGWEAI